MSSSTAVDQPNKRQRSRTGCLTCRRRRVKCDESPGVCINCRNFGAQCEWATSTSGHNIIFTPQHVTVVSGNPSRRPACDSCRIAKTRCDRDVPSCSRCREDRLECVYGHRRRRPAQPVRGVASSDDHQADHQFRISPLSAFAEPSNLPQMSHTSTASLPSPHPSVHTEDKLSSRADLTQLLDAFFRYVHPEMAMSFIHRGQLYRRLEESWTSRKDTSVQGTSPLLLKCMAAASSRYLQGANASHPDGGSLPEQWAKEAKMAITLELDRFSITKLAATLCIIHHEYCSGRIGSAWTWTALATRMCVGMSLHLGSSSSSTSEDSAERWIEDEGRRRLVWATVCADAWSACGLSECTTFDRRLVEDLALPSTERDFAFGHGPVSGQHPAKLCRELEHGQLRGISANHIWLTILGSDVQWYLKHILDDPRPWEEGSPFHQLQKRLDSWVSRCAPDMQFSVSNMYARKDDTDFGAWLHIHLHADQIGFVLRCFAMPGYEDTLPTGHLEDAPPEWVDETREACARYARSLAEKVLAVTQRFPDFVPANWTWNIFAYGSVREQLSYLSLQSGGRDVPDTPRRGNDPTSSTRRRSSGATSMEDGLQAMIFLLYRMTIWFDQNHRIARDMLRMVMNQGINLQADWIDQLRSRMSGDKTPGVGKTQVLARMPFLRRYIRHPDVDESGGTELDHSPSDRLFNGNRGVQADRSVASSGAARQLWTDTANARSSHEMRSLLDSQVSQSPTLAPASPFPQTFSYLPDLANASASNADAGLGFDLFDLLNDPINLATAPMAQSEAPPFALPWQQAPHFGIMANDNAYMSFMNMEMLSGMMPMSDNLDQEGRGGI